MPLAVEGEFLLPEVIRRPFTGDKCWKHSRSDRTGAIDDRVRELIARLTGAVRRDRDVQTALNDLALSGSGRSDQSIDHAPLAIFALAAGFSAARDADSEP